MRKAVLVSLILFALNVAAQDATAPAPTVPAAPPNDDMPATTPPPVQAAPPTTPAEDAAANKEFQIDVQNFEKAVKATLPEALEKQINAQTGEEPSQAPRRGGRAAPPGGGAGDRNAVKAREIMRQALIQSAKEREKEAATKASKKSKPTKADGVMEHSGL